MVHPRWGSAVTSHMPLIYPDLSWYAAISERKRLPGRCPYANVHRCPRYFESTALLSDKGITTRMPRDLHDSVVAKWKAHELSPATAETATSISGGDHPSTFSNFCPEVAYDTFRLFAVTLIRITDDPIDREIAEQLIKEDPAPSRKDWRLSWGHVEPLHYSDCPFYAKLSQEKPVSNITFNAPVTGNVNVAGHSVSAPIMSISLAELLTKIEASNVSTNEKEAAKSRLAEFLTHPVVAAIIGGLAGKVGG